MLPDAHPRRSPIYPLDWDGFEPTGAVGDRRRRTGGPGRRSRSREAHDTRCPTHRPSESSLSTSSSCSPTHRVACRRQEGARAQDPAERGGHARLRPYSSTYGHPGRVWPRPSVLPVSQLFFYRSGFFWLTHGLLEGGKYEMWCFLARPAALLQNCRLSRRSNAKMFTVYGVIPHP